MSVSCSSDEPTGNTTSVTVDHTLLMYLPWSTNLTSSFYQNISDMEQCIVNQGGLTNQRVMVFISTSSSEASLMELTYAGGQCQRKTVKTYQSPALTTADGISEILSDMASAAPARHYSMSIGAHGLGWVPVQSANKAKISAADRLAHERILSGEISPLLTRYFGSSSDINFKTDISTLDEAIRATGLKMEYILFDVCHMATVEVAYQLKDAADYIIASTCEVMSYGVPFTELGSSLMGDPDYDAVCNQFVAYYTNTSTPYATLSVIDCSQLDKLASVMKRVNQAGYTISSSALSSVQTFDGYTPALFYEMDNYVSTLIGSADAQLLSDFQAQMERTVISKATTPKYYLSKQGRGFTMRSHSGLAISDPSSSSYAADRESTAWWQATH